MSEVGALNVRIGADTADFSAGINRAEAQIKNFEKAVGAVGAALKPYAVALGVATAAAAAFGKSVIDAADALNDLSERTGISVEKLSQLQYVAHLSDVSIGELQGGINALTRNMSAASQGTGEASEAFRLLGINFRTSSGDLRNADELLLDLADSFSQFEDGANKTALAVAIFGKAGATMIPFLNQGRDGIRSLSDEFDRLGGTVTKEAAYQAGLFNDNLDRMKVVGKGVAQSLANDLLPVLIKMSEQFLAAQRNALSFFDRLELGIRSPFKNYQQLIQDIDRELAGFTGKENTRLAEQRKASLERQRAYYVEMAQLQALGKQQEYFERHGRAPTGGTRRTAPVLSGEKEKKSIEDMNAHLIAYLEHQEKLRQAEQTRREQIAAGVESLRFALLTEQEQLAETYAQRIAMLQEHFGSEYEQIQAYHELRAAAEQQLMDRLAEIRKRGLTDLEKFNEASFKDQAKTVAQQLMNMTASVTRESRAMFNINKAASLANAVVSTYEGINKALASYPPPLSFAMAAAQAAAGFANVRAIASQQFGSGAAAPSVASTTPAGATAVSPVGGGGGGGGTMGQQVVTINLTGEIFGRDQVRGLISQINEAISDGAQLRLQ